MLLKKLFIELGEAQQECKYYYANNVNKITLARHRLQYIYDNILDGTWSVKDSLEKIKKIDTAQIAHLDILERIFRDIKNKFTKELKNDYIKDDKDIIYADLFSSPYGLPYNLIKKRLETILKD